MSKAKLIDALQRLSEFKLPEPPTESSLLLIADITIDLLLASFQFGKHQKTFSAEEKRLASVSVSKGFKNIAFGLTEAFSQLDSEQLITAQTLRSGLQFFVDTFGSGSLKNCEPINDLEKLEAVEELTRVSIVSWSTPPFDPFSSHETPADLTGVPSTHFWWHPGYIIDSQDGCLARLKYPTMYPDWNDPGVRQWKKHAEEQQNKYCKLFGKGNWDEYRPPEFSNLRSRIAWALFKNSESITEVHDLTEYSEKQIEMIDSLYGVVVEKSDPHQEHIMMSFLFIFVYTKIDRQCSVEPVIRLLKTNKDSIDDSLYIDSNGKVYVGWSEFLEHKTLPPCLYCYPTNCYYSVLMGENQLDITFEETHDFTTLLPGSSKTIQDLIKRNRNMSNGSSSREEINDATAFDSSMDTAEIDEQTNEQPQISGLKSKLNDKEFDVLQRVIDNTLRRPTDATEVDCYLLKIRNVVDFFRILTTVYSNFDENDQLWLTDAGLIYINQQLMIHPKAFAQMTEDNQRLAVQVTRKFRDGQLTEDEFLKTVQDMCSNEQIAFEKHREIALLKITKAFKVTDFKLVEVNGNRIFRDIKPYEIDRLATVMRVAGKNYDPDMCAVGKMFAEKEKCSNASEFCSMIEFASKFIEDAKPVSDQSKKECKRALMTELQDPRSTRFNDMKTDFDELFAKVAPVNRESKFRFSDDTQATYHFYKHNVIGGHKVDVSMYFQLAQQLFGEEINRSNSKVTQDGDMVKITYTSSSAGLIGVTIQPSLRFSENDTLYTVSVATMRYDKRYLNSSSSTVD